MKKMSDASKNIFRVYHIGITEPKKKNGSNDMKQSDSSIIIATYLSYMSTQLSEMMT
jgi:hypothetical protein